AYVSILGNPPEHLSPWATRSILWGITPVPNSQALEGEELEDSGKSSATDGSPSGQCLPALPGVKGPTPEPVTPDKNLALEQHPPTPEQDSPTLPRREVGAATTVVESATAEVEDGWDGDSDFDDFQEAPAAMSPTPLLVSTLSPGAPEVPSGDSVAWGGARAGA
ncbi:unnamed protein product, partial [Discosporangium mesarthrocarpum]